MTAAADLRPLRRRLIDCVDVVRAREWWVYKLAPIFAVFYGTARVAGVAVSALWPQLIVALLALAADAGWVSVVNDLTDAEEDAASGKRNRLAGRPRALATALIAGTMGMGAFVCTLWRHDRPLISLYLAGWLAFSLYSLPPFRWKSRGVLGVLCDASGAHLFPTLVAVLLAFRGAGAPVDGRWTATVAVWAFANGVRGILWHQLSDLANDRRAGVRTFAARHAPEAIGRFAAWVVFPLEVAALAAMLWRMRGVWPAAVLTGYAAVLLLRARWWGVAIVVAAPKERFRVAMHEYYDALLGPAILIASALRHPADWVVLLAHLLLFPTRSWRVIADAATLAALTARSSLRLVLGQTTE